jgi:uncharacterized protein
MFDFMKPLRSARARPWLAAAIAIVIAAVLSLAPPIRQWPVAQLAPLLIYLLLARLHGAFALDARCFARGRPAWSLALLFALVSVSALALWLWMARPDLAAAMAHIPAMPMWLLPLAGLGFALVNAALEEALFRGIIYDRLRAAFGGGAWPHLLQASLFGLAHLHGVPNGLAGVVLAGAWALGLSILRERSGGLLAPWLAHVAADIGVFALLTTNLAKG